MIDYIKMLVPLTFVVLVCAGLFGIPLLLGNKRRRHMKAFASKTGARFRPGLDEKVQDLLPQMQGSQMRLSMHGFNTIRGTMAVAGVACDWMMGDCEQVNASD